MSNRSQTLSSSLRALIILCGLAISGCGGEPSTSLGGEESSTAGAEVADSAPRTAAMNWLPASLPIVLRLDFDRMRSNGLLERAGHMLQFRDSGDHQAAQMLEYLQERSRELVCGLEIAGESETDEFICILSGRFEESTLRSFYTDGGDSLARNEHGFLVMAENDPERPHLVTWMLNGEQLLFAHRSSLDSALSAAMDGQGRLTARDEFSTLSSAAGFGQHMMSLVVVYTARIRALLDDAAGDDAAREALFRLFRPLDGVTMASDLDDSGSVHVGLHATEPEAAPQLAGAIRMLASLLEVSKPEWAPYLIELVVSEAEGVVSMEMPLARSDFEAFFVALEDDGEEDESEGASLGGPEPFDQTLDGEIGEGDLVLEQDGSLYDEYELDVAQGMTIIIDMQSTELDPYILLQGPEQGTVAQNDDISEDDHNSHLEYTVVTAGRHKIIANTYDAGERGRYTLRVRTQAEAGGQSAASR